MNVLLKKALTRTLVFLLWTFVSAWLFVLVEKTEKDDVKEKNQLLRSLYKSMATKYNMSIEEFNNFSKVAHDALADPKLEWNFFAAVDFVFQSLTTIGYGYITPQTTEGQILCIFVSLIGIPITMLALKSVGEVLAKLINTIVTKFERKVLKRPDPRKVETKSAMFLFSFTVITLFVGGWFQTFKNLTVTEGVYMWYITFTTIGFGDYVPFKRSRTVVKFSEDGLRYHGELSDSEKPFPDYFGWLILSIGILGLCVVSAVLNSIMAVIEERKFRPRCHGCIPRKIQNHTNSKQPNPSEQAEIGETCLEIENCGFEKENIASTNSAKLERVCQRKALKYALPLTFRGSSYEERLTMLDLTTRQGGLIYLC